MFVYLSSAIGLVLGSFFAALSWRYPRGISITQGRSKCPSCKHQILAIDNIPLLSFLFLGGKCRNCKHRISVRYPIIEASTAIGFWYLSLIFQKDIFFLFYSLIIFSILLLIFIIDFEHKIIPDSLIFVGLATTTLFYLITNNLELTPALFGGLMSSLALLIIHIITRGRGMGLGDVKFAVWGGMIVGLKLNLIWLFLAFLTGGITGIILILGKRAGLKDQIAFGPFLIISMALSLLFGDELILFLGY